MDYLSTFYTRKARFSPDGPLVTIRWYPCLPGAKLFPHVHRFGSLFWQTVEAQPGCVGGPDPAPPPDPLGVGEAERAFRTVRPDNAGYLGRCFVGRPEWYRLGVPANVLLGPPAGPMPECCRAPIFEAAGGGVELAGAAQFGPPRCNRGVSLNGAATIQHANRCAMGVAVPRCGADFGFGSVLVSDGGPEVGGLASYPWTLSSLGGVELAGAGGLAENRGGVELAGSAEFFAASMFESLGGVELAGAAELSFAGTTQSQGGVELAGEASLSFNTALQGQGGVELAGEADFITVPVFEGLGGVEIAGGAGMVIVVVVEGVPIGEFAGEAEFFF